MKQKYFVAFGIIMLIPLVSCLAAGTIFSMQIYYIGCAIGLFLLTYVFYMSKILRFFFGEEMTTRSNNINLKINTCVLIIFLIFICILLLGLIIG